MMSDAPTKGMLGQKLHKGAASNTQSIILNGPNDVVYFDVI